MSERPSVLGTVFLWFFVMLVAIAVLAHGTAKGRAVLRDAVPLHQQP